MHTRNQNVDVYVFNKTFIENAASFLSRYFKEHSLLKSNTTLLHVHIFTQCAHKNITST